MEELPPSRPLTPSEQMDIMYSIENEEKEQSAEPSKRDLEVCSLTILVNLWPCGFGKFWEQLTL